MLRDTVDDELRASGQRLLAAVAEHNALGLAAAHIGEVLPIVAVGDGTAPVRLLYNPRITGTSAEIAKGDEGSVSLPGIRVEVERPVWVDVVYMDEGGRPVSERLTGVLGRVAIHEIEQMQGIFFLDRVSRLKRDMALRKARKLPG